MLKHAFSPASLGASDQLQTSHGNLVIGRNFEADRVLVPAVLLAAILLEGFSRNAKEVESL
jgi:hypothetical protein